MDPAQRRTIQPHSVIVFPMFEGRMVWTKHPLRGFEVPGGKLEEGESPEVAVRRECFEETGCKLSKNPMWIAEYRIVLEYGMYAYKWIYFAHVEDVSAKPSASETGEVEAVPLKAPHLLRQRQDVSPIMKDAVYETILPLLRDFAQRDHSLP